MNLAKFLLERIIEDEAWAAEHPHFNNQAPDFVPRWWTRVLDDCAARRAIVEWCSERERIYIGRLGQDPTDPDQWAPGQLKHPQDAPVLRFLAQPYADHPDFREEWRA